ncbi:MAG: YfhO family protein, partial [Candidatus Omnitrophica bacterium]|nr:YfhO family protein [Candidatus Omnitrophota bacterium]
MKNSNQFLIACMIIVVGITFYTLPLILNMDKGVLPDQKNFLSAIYFQYFLGGFYRFSIISWHQFPLWNPFYEGGAFLFGHPVDLSCSPSSVFILLFGVIKGLAVSWYFMYVFGAISMYYLTRKVLKYDLYGAFYSTVVFTMCGFFPYMQVNGYLFARDMLLLPLLLAFFIKAKYKNKYIIYSALILAWLFTYSCFYFLIAVAFLGLFALFYAFQKEGAKFTFKRRYIVVFFCAVILCGIYSAGRLLPLLDFLRANSTPSNFTYEETISQANTMSLLRKHLLDSLESGVGTAYVGYLPVILSLTACTVFFKKLSRWVMILTIFILLSFGPNAFFDIHHLLWNLPIFHSMREISKYYVVIIVFIISITSGNFFSILKITNQNKTGKIIAIGLIAFTYGNLLWANVGYFNAYNYKIRFWEPSEYIAQVKTVCMHQGDEGGALALRLALFLKGYGLVNAPFFNQYFDEQENTTPKYFAIPQYAFLMPSTKIYLFENPAYLGEAYFSHEKNKVNYYSMAPTQIKIKVDLSKPDRLVINQKFSKHWMSNSGKVEKYMQK